MKQRNSSFVILITLAFLITCFTACKKETDQLPTGSNNSNSGNAVATVSTLAGGEEGYADGSGTQAKFKFPVSLTVASNGTIYVTDCYGLDSKLRKITPDGIVTTPALSFGQGFYSQFDFLLCGSTFGPDSALYLINNVLTPVMTSIVRVSSSGMVTQIAMGFEKSGFTKPYDMVFASDGTLFIADSDNDRIVKLTPNGQKNTLAGGERGDADGEGAQAKFFNPTGITITSDGTLYVADRNNNKIRKITPAGVVSTIATGLNHPTDLVISKDGTLYIADQDNNRIIKLTTSGQISTVVGGDQGYADGEGNQAKFSRPTGIAIATDGTLYVADYGNHRVRKIRLK